MLRAATVRPVRHSHAHLAHGVEGDRTPDPRLAKPVLSQLSYNPPHVVEKTAPHIEQ